MTTVDHTASKPRTRAEQVRARRARQQKQVEPLSNVPKPKRRKRPRRRYDVALPVEIGAEMSLPAVPNVRFGARLVSLPLIVFLSWLLVYSLNAPFFQIEQAAVEGAVFLAGSQIRSMADVDRQTIFTIDPRFIKQGLEASSEIALAEVQIGWPNKVSIEVIERSPVVEWVDSGRDWWLSEEGIAYLSRDDQIELVRVVSEVSVLVIDEDPLQPVVDPDLLLMAGVLKSQLPEVQELLFDPILGFGIDDPRGWRGYFGSDGNMIAKVRLYRAISDELLSRGSVIETISVANPAAPYYVDAR